MDEQAFFFGLEGPLDSPPSPGQVRAANLRGFSDCVRARNGDPHRILHRFGLEPHTLATPDDLIACQQMVDMFEYCSNVFDDPLFGLRLGAMQDAEVYGCVTAVCRASPDLRAALHCLVDYLPVAHSPDAAIELAEHSDTAELRWAVRSDLGVNDQANYQALMLNLKLLQMLAGKGFVPTTIMLSTHARPRDLPEIERLAGFPVQTGAPHSAIAFPRKLLEQPQPGSNRLIYRLLGGYLARLKIRTRENTVERAKSYVRGALPTGNCSIERCAEQMGISVRTLQIRLANHDIVYSDLVEAEREKLARIYLSQTRMPLDEVAERLGYGEQTSFGRAFKRWTGTTPQKFRHGA